MIIYQPQEGYCYNSDTIFLYHFIRRFPLRGNVLDVGTGSGILALLVARDFKAQVDAIEIQEHFVHYAKINAKANKLPVTVYLGDFLHMHFAKRYDYIITNPPFYHTGVLRSKNPIIDKARYSGHMPFEKFIKKANQILKPKGGIIFCYDAKQTQTLLMHLSANKFTVEAMQFVHPNAQKEASLVMIYAKKSSKSLCAIVPPLIVFENGEYREETKRIFEEVGAYSIKCHI